MLASTTDLTDNPLALPRLDTTTTEIETLVFLELNAEPKPPRERDLPEELTGFYYTG